VSVYDFIEDVNDGQFLSLEDWNKKMHTLPEWDEKIVDSINYLILLRALIEDMGHFRRA
jgi:hypothetical protein